MASLHNIKSKTFVYCKVTRVKENAAKKYKSKNTCKTNNKFRCKPTQNHYKKILVQFSIEKDPTPNVSFLRHDQFRFFMSRSITDLVASPKIDQSETPINTMTASCDGVQVSQVRMVGKRARLDENITFGDGTVDPACIMESVNESSSFTPVER